MKWSLFLVLLMLLSACHPQTVTSTLVVPTATSEFALTTTPTPESYQATTSTQKSTAVPAITAVPTKIYQVCSPLENETIETLPLILTNPLDIPIIGRDDGHHGLDFAYFQRDERKSIQGIMVYAILPGTTVLTLEDEIPYGYAILIETPFSELPEKLQEDLIKFYQLVPEKVVYQGECPEITPPKVTGEMSVYHLYAHLEAKPTYKHGDAILCGAELGTVGNTGRSSNPHLHLETRLGPSDAKLGDMAFYGTMYTEQQRSNYCLWRMSGYFQLFDPFLLFNAGG